MEEGGRGARGAGGLEPAAPLPGLRVSRFPRGSGAVPWPMCVACVAAGRPCDCRRTLQPRACVLPFFHGVEDGGRGSSEGLYCPWMLPG